MRRGFKSQCEQISKRYRKELGLTLEEALPYRRFAEHLGVRIWTPYDVPELDAKFTHQLTVVDESDWSAMTLQDEGKTLIIINSSHSERRLANDVTHELSHLILDHKKARLDVSDDRHLWLKSYGGDQEEEADWLSAALLLPRDGLMKLYSETQDFGALADIYAVSEQLVRMRVNRTGIARQFQSSRKRNAG